MFLIFFSSWFSVRKWRDDAHIYDWRPSFDLGTFFLSFLISACFGDSVLHGKCMGNIRGQKSGLDLLALFLFVVGPGMKTLIFASLADI
jgi:hypothetical protein